MITLSGIEQHIADILVEAALKGKTVTFTEIMEKLHIGRRYLGDYLSHIGQKCEELGLPIITVIVVYKNSGKVGSGYAEFDPNYTKQSVEEAQKKVFSQDSWEGLSQNVVTWTNDILLNEVENVQASAKEGELVKVSNMFVRKRDARLREECLKKNGKVCSICGFDPAKLYGTGFENIIEVHHLNPIADGERETTIDNLIPVCPNCHRALHSKHEGLYTPDELKEQIKKNK